MAQPTVEDDFNTMSTLNSIFLPNADQPSSPTEEIAVSRIIGYTSEELLDGMDFEDLPSLCSDPDFQNLIYEMQSREEIASSNSDHDEISELLYDGLEEPRSIEPSDTADSNMNTDEHLAMIKPDASALPVIRSSIEKTSIQPIVDQSISLSNSVAVTVHTDAPNRLQLVCPLEETYRARYKSDYFPQKGEPRRPRYVADNKGHHWVTLQLPTGYNRDLKNEYIRVALVTQMIGTSGRYYSPYKFQIDHRNSKVSDENPIFIPVQTVGRSGSTLKLQLVLIKSKLDQLNSAQPLRPFTDTIGDVSNIVSQEKLVPKELINKYQLDKSQIAFTLCTKRSKDNYEIHSDTTVISTTISELPPKQAAAATAAAATSKNKSETNAKTPAKTISCPNCAHCFEIPNETIGEKGNKRKSIAKTTSTNSKSSTATTTTTNKKRKTGE